MAKGDKPSARLMAIVQVPDGQRQGETKDQWIELCALWSTEGGNLQGRIDAEPIQWRMASTPRQIVVQYKREG